MPALALRLLVAATILSITLVAAATAGAEESPPTRQALEIGSPPPCGDSFAVTLSALECLPQQPEDSLELFDLPVTAPLAETALPADGSQEASLAPSCRLHGEAVFYAESDWIRLAQHLAAGGSECAEYYVSVPPLSNSKTMPRPGQAERLRALGANVHAVAEAHLGAWQTWVIANQRTWYEAGLEFRARMAAAGYDVLQGDLWSLNEVPSSVRQNLGQSRANLREFLRGLYEGDGLPAKGIVFVIGISQGLEDTSVYHGTLKGWLADEGFWTDVAESVRFWSQEVYADARRWGVDASPRLVRARYLVDYLLHPLALARAGGEETAAAERFFRTTYTPLANGAWTWRSGFGWTDLPADQMKHFVSEQAHAIRFEAGSDPAAGPAGRIGFAWSPRNAGTPPLPPLLYQGALASILERLTSAIVHAYAHGGGSPQAACGTPGEHDWCEGAVPEAAFNDAWARFRSWG